MNAGTIIRFILTKYKNNNLNNEFLNRIEVLDTRFFSVDIECNDKTRKYFYYKYDNTEKILKIEEYNKYLK